MKKRSIMRKKAVRKQKAQATSWYADSRTRACVTAITGILTGSMILYFHGLNNLFNSYYHSEKLLYYPCPPAIFEFLNRICGFAVISISVLYILYTLYWKKAIDDFLKHHYRAVLIFLLSGMGMLAIIVCFHKFFNNDEIEHIHSAWYVKNGHIPYRDFFQHHNPLLWYLLLPFLYLFGDSVYSILTARLFMFSVMLSIALFTCLISRAITKSNESGLVSVALLFSTVLFMAKGFEIRPDVPQVLFGLISIYCLVRFFQSMDNRYIIFSGLSAAISFLFLQKAIFLLIAYVMILGYGLVKRELSAKSLLYFIGSLLLPLLIFWMFLQMTGSLHDYFLTNWQLNRQNLGSQEITAKPFGPMAYSLEQNALFWILALASIIFVFVKKSVCKEMKLVVFIGLSQIFCLFIYSVTFKHYYLFAIPLLCISASYFLVYLFDKFNIIETHRVALLAVFLFGAVPFLLIDNFHSNQLQLGKINYVLNLTKDSDCVYDGANAFNPFRRDLHYFWYQLSSGLQAYNLVSGNRFSDYDICTLIRVKKPKIISDVMFDFNSCRLQTLYNTTAYPHLYIRRDDL
jgi:hypothetical protein